MYLNIEGINKSFLNEKNEQINILEHIHMGIEKGEFVSIVGPSGCGKSTLLNIIAGLEKADTGFISISGKTVNKPGPDRVVVFQEDGLFPWLSVFDNVMYGLKLQDISRMEQEKKVIEVLKMVHLSKNIHSYPHQLSGGMKQRVAIARALVMEPDILLMDEPFSALDEQTKMLLHHELLEIWKKTEVTIFFVTHDIREAVQLSEKIIVFGTRPGRVKEVIQIPTKKDSMVPDSLTMNIEQRILMILQKEMEKVWKGEMGDDYDFKANQFYRDHSGNLGNDL